MNAPCSRSAAKSAIRWLRGRRQKVASLIASPLGVVNVTKTSLRFQHERGMSCAEGTSFGSWLSRDGQCGQPPARSRGLARPGWWLGLQLVVDELECMFGQFAVDPADGVVDVPELDVPELDAEVVLCGLELDVVAPKAIDVPTPIRAPVNAIPEINNLVRRFTALLSSHLVHADLARTRESWRLFS